MKLERFWKFLGEIGMRSAAQQYFMQRLGDEFPAVEQFILREPAARGGELQVSGFPCPRCKQSHTVERIGPNAFIAFADEDEIRTPCPDIEGLTEDDVWPRHFDFEAIGRTAAVALAVTPDISHIEHQLWRIGLTEISRLPVFLCIGNSIGAYLNAADTILSKTPGQFLLLTATVRPRVMDRLGKNTGACFAMADVLTVGPENQFTAVATAERLIAAGLPVATVTPKGPPIPLRGRRYEIEDGFTAITRLKPKERYPIEQLNCREALHVLVESGANSEKAGISKDDWCKAVWRIRTPDEPLKKEAKPINFFRVRRKGKTETLPWYEDVIKNDNHGMYWLNL